MNKILCFMLLAVSPAAWATDYYFSGCSNAGHLTGCYDNPVLGSCTNPGTSNNPYCIDPDGDGGRQSLMFLFDGTNSGTNKEVGAGDNVYLCADTCNGSGTETWTVMCTSQQDDSNGTGSPDTSRTLWFNPQTGSSGAAITIQNYSGEQIVFDGDTDQDRVFDNPGTTCNATTTTVDLDMFGVHNGKRNIHWLGNTLSSARAIPGSNAANSDKGIVFQKTHDGWYFQTDDGGPRGWSFDGILFQHIGNPSWAGNTHLCRDTGGTEATCDLTPGTGISAFTPPLSHYPACYDGADHRVNPFTFKVVYMDGGTFDVNNSIFRHECAWAYRLFANNPTDGSGGPGGAAFTFNNDQYLNINYIANVFKAFQNSTDTPSTYTFINSTAQDQYGGITMEEEVRGITIENNSFSVLGVYKAHPMGRYAGAIIGRTDAGGSSGDTSGARIRKNRFTAVATNPQFAGATCPGSGCGWWDDAPIHWKHSCVPSQACSDTPANTCGCTLIDTIIENNFFNFPVQFLGNLHEQAAISVSNDNDPGVIVRNNTIVGGAGGINSIYLDGSGVMSVINNIAKDCPDACLRTEGATPTTGIDYNNFYKSSGNVMNLNGTTYTCAAFAGFGTGNKCASSTFVSTSGTPDTWDLHLPSNDTVNKDLGTTGATEDIDGTSRPQGSATDLGADELVAASSTRRLMLTRQLRERCILINEVVPCRYGLPGGRRKGVFLGHP